MWLHEPKKMGKPDLIYDALRPVQSDVFHCRENVHFLLSLDLLGNIEGDTKQSTSFCTIPEIREIIRNFTSKLMYVISMEKQCKRNIIWCVGKRTEKVSYQHVYT